LLIPLQYNGCWSAEVNGKNAEVRSVMSLLTAVELNGESTNFNAEIFISYIIVAEIIFPKILFVLILALFKLKPYFDLFIPQIAEANKISVDIRNKNFGVEIGLMSLEKLQKVCDMYNNFGDVSAQNYSQII